MVKKRIKTGEKVFIYPLYLDIQVSINKIVHNGSLHSTGRRRIIFLLLLNLFKRFRLLKNNKKKRLTDFSTEIGKYGLVIYLMGNFMALETSFYESKIMVYGFNLALSIIINSLSKERN